ncbi:hypothetical protein Vretimale_4509 [Volvox reticuliferus]|uniref:CNNM transmembrane domain-containing protein n=1 Tax=Volvox reticuliferus TaxID=1737510 RepID=A0A8J4DBG7_9CHLO|nr:hypothetical protein Vretimale_4509 [Volvox reticuliferus]
MCRYGLAIGASLAPLVRLLMWLCSPVAWPMGKLLDLLIGADHHTIFRRRQLKELVSIHAEDAGMGGALTRDEIKVITGALDLTSKVAYRAMTPLDKVFMLSSSDRLNEATLRSILHSGHSRIPVHREGDRGDVVGLVLVKELLQYRLGSSDDVPVSMLRIRSIPRLPATTRMYDMLRLFQTGRSHIAVLTQPPAGELRRLVALDPSFGTKRPFRDMSRSRGCGKDRCDWANAEGGAVAAARQHGIAGGGASTAADELAATGKLAAAVGTTIDDVRAAAAETEGDAENYLPYSLYYAASGGIDTSYPPSALDPQESSETAATVATLDTPASFRHWSIGGPDTPRREDRDANASRVDQQQGGAASNPPGLRPLCTISMFEAPTAFPIAAEAAAAEATGGAILSICDAPAATSSMRTAMEAATPLPLQPGGPPPPPLQHGGHQLTRIGLETFPTAAASTASEAGRDGNAWGLLMPGGGAALEAGEHRPPDASVAGMGFGSGTGGPATTNTGAVLGISNLPSTARRRDDVVVDYDPDEPEEGRPIGIITIEDVIEELIRAEIVDETDRYIDNNRLIRANQAQLAQSLPEHLAKVLAAAGASKKKAAFHRAISSSLISQSMAPSRRSYAAGLGLGGSGSTGWAGPIRDFSQASSQHQSQASLRTPLLYAEQL